MTAAAAAALFRRAKGRGKQRSSSVDRTVARWEWATAALSGRSPWPLEALPIDGPGGNLLASSV